MFRADPLSAYSLNVENSPTAQIVRRFNAHFAQRVPRLSTYAYLFCASHKNGNVK